MSLMMTIKERHQRYRKLFQFQLDLNDSADFSIAETIYDLKRSRAYTQTIRDGIRLICDLRNGKTDVLYELFPWVMEQKNEASSQTIISDSADKFSDILKQEMERITQVLIQQGAKPLEIGEGSPAIKATFNESDFDIKQATSSEDDKPTWNFMISSNLSIYGHCDYLPSEIQEYAVKTGRISADKVKPKTPQKVAKMEGNAKNLANANQVPEAPNFDDVEIF